MSDKDDSLSEVNVIPLADLSLVLLIILMVLSPMASQALIQVAKAKAAAAQTREELATPEPETPIIVSFSPEALKLNGNVMSSDIDLVTHLDNQLPTRKDKSVILTAAPQLMHGEVVRLMDILKRHGAETLVLLKWDEHAPGNQQGAHS